MERKRVTRTCVAVWLCTLYVFVASVTEVSSATTVRSQQDGKPFGISGYHGGATLSKSSAGEGRLTTLREIDGVQPQPGGMPSHPNGIDMEISERIFSSLPKHRSFSFSSGSADAHETEASSFFSHLFAPLLEGSELRSASGIFPADLPSVSTLLTDRLDEVVRAILQAILPVPLDRMPPQLGEGSSAPSSGPDSPSRVGASTRSSVVNASGDVFSSGQAASEEGGNGSGVHETVLGGELSRLHSIIRQFPQLLLVVGGHLLFFVFVFHSRRRQGLQLLLLFFLSFLLLCSKHVSDVCDRLLYNYGDKFAFCHFFSLSTEEGQQFLLVFWCIPLLACLVTLAGLLLWELTNSVFLLAKWKKQAAEQARQRQSEQGRNTGHETHQSGLSDHAGEGGLRCRVEPKRDQ
ncbi:conserved hypothetical protein [Neospora caninum Liverpool]|uniref:Transmembrane protein n=1 Tax=Neospora caninum (strain Liverpool) TaxID=572307 RepID=F0VM26_NEOCL|nr:conserved hypothetical protein [Neospora caninum Liverpool]CBZ54304.1 conserved hypothetical protein [Neospora caninum Liverpool]CEL69010.1 TPA: hypothetical protein BN1204_047360 [Neospora caninum Liverpool]|eukprot:XP_003884335.1 conserved hypothetical protein [Neospora caninum Liverpool]